MDKEFERLWYLFLIEFGLIVFVYFNGGEGFIKNQPFNSIMISIGILTFISVFYGFIFRKIKSLQDSFIDTMGDFKEEEWTRVIENALKKNTEKTLESVQEIERIESFSSNIKPIRGLFLATFSFLLSIVIFFSSSYSNVPILNLNLHSVSTVLFFLGILFNFFLLNSFLILLISENKAREKIRSFQKDNEPDLEGLKNILKKVILKTYIKKIRLIERKSNYILILIESSKNSFQHSK
jgi:magnesium-transporting ATPase (P-type)